MTTCPCVARHAPAPAYLQSHHVIPSSWGGANVAANKQGLCGTTHDAVHAGLNLSVKLKRYPTLAQLRAAGVRNRYAQGLALRALDEYLDANGGVWPTKLTLHQEAP